MNLPVDFAQRMKLTLGEEYDEFVSSYESSRAYGLRSNPVKIDEGSFSNIMDIELTPVSWCSTGFYYSSEDRPGKNVLHEAGAYYIQEPSAMSVVDLLGIKPGDKVLDLCAAPGGKSTQAAGKLMGTGVLVSNEIVPKRAKILSQNIERMGISNCVVTNMSPDELESHYKGFFDKIIVDAPCSGEGMFNKEEAALTEWSTDNVDMCASRQRDILKCAVEMLKTGGTLVYSTCTFSEEENEKNVQWLTNEYSDMHVLPIDVESKGMSKGYDEIISGCARIWPHKQKGEGHFVARLIKGDVSGDEFGESESAMGGAITDAMKCTYKKIAFGDNMYLYPECLPNPKGQRIERPGLHVWTDLKKRKEPAHALAMAIKGVENQPWIKDVFDEIEIKSICFSETDKPEKFIAGESVACEPDLKGWCIVTYHGLSLGWGKASGGIMKNHYPKGLRKQVM